MSFKVHWERDDYDWPGVSWSETYETKEEALEAIETEWGSHAAASRNGQVRFQVVDEETEEVVVNGARP